MADLNGTVSGGQRVTGTVGTETQTLQGSLRLSGGGGGSTVSYTQTQTSGNELGTITIDGDSKKIYSPTETDPTVPSWAKASTKPSYTASEVGAVPTSRTVNGKALSSNISLTASDVGAQETLVSGTNIKTVNGNSLLGSGDITIQGGGIVVLSVESFSSLPQTVSNAIITADMICLKSELGTPSAQTGNWTVTTASGSLTIAGTISGSTTATLYLARKEN